MYIPIGVTPDMDFRFTWRKYISVQENHPGFETHGEGHTKSKIGKSVAPQNGPGPIKNSTKRFRSLRAGLRARTPVLAGSMGLVSWSRPSLSWLKRWTRYCPVATKRFRSLRAGLRARTPVLAGSMGLVSWSRPSLSWLKRWTRYRPVAS